MVDFVINNIGYILLGCFAYWVVKCCYVSYVTLKTRYDLYRLRDQVRKLAIEHPNYNEHIFEYLDETCSKSVNNLSKYDVWILIYYILKDRIFFSSSFDKRSRAIRHVLEHDKLFKPCYERYVAIVTKYVRHRSFISYYPAAIIGLILSVTIDVLSKVIAGRLSLIWESFQRATQATNNDLKSQKLAGDFHIYSDFSKSSSRFGKYFAVMEDTSYSDVLSA